MPGRLVNSGFFKKTPVAPRSRARTGQRPAPKPQRQPQRHAEAEEPADAEAAAKAEPDAETEPDAEAEPDAETELDAEAEPDAEARPAAKAEGHNNKRQRADSGSASKAHKKSRAAAPPLVEDPFAVGAQLTQQIHDLLSERDEAQEENKSLVAKYQTLQSKYTTLEAENRGLRYQLQLLHQARASERMLGHSARHRFRAPRALSWLLRARRQL